jgi:hypothetical protein
MRPAAALLDERAGAGSGLAARAVSPLALPAVVAALARAAAKFGFYALETCLPPRG